MLDGKERLPAVGIEKARARREEGGGPLKWIASWGEKAGSPVRQNDSSGMEKVKDGAFEIADVVA